MYTSYRFCVICPLRVSITGTQGQTNYTTMNMKNLHSCQNIHLASSHPETLQVDIIKYGHAH